MRVKVYFKITKTLLSRESVAQAKAIELFEKMKEKAAATSLTRIDVNEPRISYPKAEQDSWLENACRIVWDCSCPLEDLKPFIDRWNDIENKEYPFAGFMLLIGQNSGLL